MNGKHFALVLLQGLFVTEALGWVVIPSNTAQTLYGIEMNGRLVVGSAGTILYDGAVHVNKSSVDPSYRVDYQPQTSGTTRDLYAVHCINTCWAAGDSGTLLHRAANSWAAVPSGTNKALRAVYFSSDSEAGFVAGDSGTILRKNGALWEAMPTGVSQRLNAIHFQYNYLSGSNPNRFDTGFAVGAEGTILKSTNRGSTWVKLTSGVTHALYSFHFWDNSEAGFAVGASGTILKTTNRGTTWTLVPSGTTNTLYSVYFTGPLSTSNQTGFAVGQAGTMLVSTDGGDTWIPDNSGTSQALHSLVMGGPSGGIAAGAAGTIVAANPVVSITDYKTRMVSDPRIRLTWSLNEGVRLRDAQGNLYDLQGQRVPNRELSRPKD